jgi:hypothetical protein
MSEPLLDMLRADGARVSEGGFTLDRAKAREKLSKFQLVDPHHYVLEFVQAAHILGASYVDIELDANEMRMQFDGTKLTRTELENLYRASFAQSNDVKLRALRHLAIGVTAAWSLDPHILRIVIDDGDSRLRAELSPDGDDEITVEQSRGSTGTTIYLRERVRPAHLLDFFRHLQGLLAEEVALRDFCAHSDIPILLNGDSVSDGHRLRERARGIVAIDTPHETGRVGVTLEAGFVPTHISVLTHGVRITEIHGSEEPFGFDAIVDSDRLRKGLSQSEVVRDRNWQMVRYAVVGEAVYRSLARFVSELSPLDAATYSEALRRAASWLWSPPPSNSPTPDSVLAAINVAKRAMRTAPIWPYAHTSTDLDHPGDRLVSLADIEREFEASAVYISGVEYRGDAGAQLPTAILVEPARRKIFETVFGARLRDVTDEVSRAEKRAERIDELTRRGRPSRPDPSYFDAYRDIDHGAFYGFVGIRTGNHQSVQLSHVEWTNDELILHQQRVSLGVSSLYIWFNGPLEFQMQAPHFRVSDAYADIACAMIREMPDVAAQVVDTLPAHAAVSWLGTLTSFADARDIAELLKVPDARIDAMLENALAEADLRWFDFAQRSHPTSESEIARRIQSMGPFADTPAIEVGLERRASLRELLKLYREDGFLERAHSVYPQMTGPRAITGGQREIELVERLFGPLKPPEGEEDEVFAVLQSMHGASREPQAPEPDMEVASEALPDESNADVHARYELEPAQPPRPTAEPDTPTFVDDLRALLIDAQFVGASKPIRLDDAPGSPAAFIDGATCVVNAAHPVIADAVASPESTDDQRWATTAALVALAAGGNRTMRAFAFEHLADQLGDR